MAVTAMPLTEADELLEETVRPRRWTRKEYHRAAALGILRSEERLELLDGEILERMSPQLPPHANAILRTGETLRPAFGAGHHVRPQLPLVVDDYGEPEPDVAIVVGTHDDYARETPGAAHARLVVEVADTTLRLDRGRKQHAYARAGIPEYWILNLKKRQLEVYRDPSDQGYLSVTIYGEGETVTPLGAPNAAIRVADLLPAA